ncbi:MAG: hypothetical protein J6X02_00020 [Bacilli bacterium]|nr:hypothetical protein [Bacilli bacterium]
MSAISDNNEAINKMALVIDNLEKAYNEIYKDNDNGPADEILNKIICMQRDAPIIENNIRSINGYISAELARIAKEKEEGEANDN